MATAIIIEVCHTNCVLNQKAVASNCDVCLTGCLMSATPTSGASFCAATAISASEQRGGFMAITGIADFEHAADVLAGTAAFTGTFTATKRITATAA